MNLEVPEVIVSIWLDKARILEKCVGNLIFVLYAVGPAKSWTLSGGMDSDTLVIRNSEITDIPWWTNEKFLTSIDVVDIYEAKYKPQLLSK